MIVKIANIAFDRVRYGADGDTLALHVGGPSSAVEFDETPEGHHVRFNKAGELLGVTIVNARWLLEHDGKIALSLPPRRIEAGHDTLDRALMVA